MRKLGSTSSEGHGLVPTPDSVGLDQEGSRLIYGHYNVSGSFSAWQKIKADIIIYIYIFLISFLHYCKPNVL